MYIFIKYSDTLIIYNFNLKKKIEKDTVYI